jgi:hypothetical protein
VDLVCREVRQRSEPFGGMQVIFVGRLFSTSANRKKYIQKMEMIAISGYLKKKWHVLRTNLRRGACKTYRVAIFLSNTAKMSAQFLSILSAIRKILSDWNIWPHIEARKVLKTSLPADSPKAFHSQCRCGSCKYRRAIKNYYSGKEI